MAPIIFYIFVPFSPLFTLSVTLVGNLNFSAWVNTCSHVGVSEAADRGDVTLPWKNSKGWTSLRWVNLNYSNPLRGKGFTRGRTQSTSGTWAWGRRAGLCVCVMGVMARLTHRALTNFLTHIAWNEHGGVFFGLTPEPISTISQTSHLSNQLKATKIQPEVSAAQLGRILILALLRNEVCEDTIRSQRKLWSLTSGQQRRGSVNEMIVSFVLAVNKPGENSWPLHRIRVARSLWALKWWKTTWHRVHQLVCTRTSDDERNHDVLGRHTGEKVVGRQGVHLPYL